MLKNIFFNKIEELMEINLNTITGVEKLTEIDSWDSYVVLEIITLFDSEFGKKLTIEDFEKISTYNDLYNLTLS